MNNISIIFMLGVFLLLCIVIIQCIEYFITSSNYKFFYHLVSIAILVNVFILLFLIESFNNVLVSQGPPGPKGNRGKPGNRGIDDGCGLCGKQNDTVGNRNYKETKRNLVIIEKPILAPSTYQQETNPYNSY